MKLKSFGCSFIFGNDLADADDNQNIYSQQTWPALLADKLRYNYSCYARPGAGNLQIVEQILNQTNNIDNDLFVVNWTWIDRFDYYNANHNGLLWSEWSTIMPVNNTSVAKTYYRDLHSEYRDKFTSLIYIKLAIDTLRQKNIPFIMTYMDELLFNTQWHTSPAVLELQKYIEPYMTTFAGQTFLDWSRQNNYSISDRWHPLEDAHLAASVIIFDKQNIIDR